jgi:hypothetical protein
MNKQIASKKTESSNELCTLLPTDKKGVADLGSKIYNNLQLYNLTNEIWVDMFGFDGVYEVSNLGRIKSIARTVLKSNGVEMFVKERIRKQSLMKDGRLSCNASTNGINTTLNLQAIIYLSFNSKAEYDVTKQCVMHIDKLKSNNKLSNLKIESISKSHKVNFEKGLTDHLTERGKKRTENYDSIKFRVCSICNNKKPIENFERGRRKCMRCKDLESYNTKLNKIGKKRVRNKKIYITDTVTKEVFIHTNKHNCIISNKLINRYANTKDFVIPYRNSKHKNPLLIEIR